MFSFRLTFFVHCYYYNVFLYYHLFVPAVRSSDGPRKRTNEKMVGTATRHLDEFKINCLHQFTKKELNEHAVAQWNYQVNKTEATEHEAMRSSIRLFIYQKLLVTSAENMSVAFGMSYEDLLPLVYFVHDRGICQLNTDEYKTTLMLKRKLKTTINELTVCEYRKTNHPCDVTADEINVIMASSSDAIELKYYWKAWHNHTSYDVKNIYMNYIEMLNYMARLNRFSNEVDYYMEPYNSHNQGQLNADQMYEGIRPLYLHLYTHVRKILREKFGTATVSANGPIPVHLLGSVLGQPWTKLIPFMVQEFVVHESGKTHSMTPAKRLFDQANRFFVSIGMGCVPKSVWSHSVWKDNKHFSNRQPSSWDLYANNDFSIFQDKNGCQGHSRRRVYDAQATGFSSLFRGLQKSANRVSAYIQSSVCLRRDKRTDAVRALSRLHRQVQRQREQSERLPVAVGHGKGRRPAVRLRRRRLALGSVHELFRAETHERSLVEQKAQIRGRCVAYFQRHGQVYESQLQTV
ncbi:angiotensin-converting enzyme isoform X5 [Acyrthosiphon pisum]|uniref:Angiotensin-converting enzyme n=1 Tax=Acyrthosiphon pisum TaxID=7029 RepID=A0A8R2HBJ5_ACYPI|nr:angiotensin-converting enzyme isoform X5 [Acyrthosiphon pisum]|eukprot:XP_016663351.1 PREDICTED: angiotensin-converting enzyme-like isoform X5 [Acyrthosiphon pisum]